MNRFSNIKSDFLTKKDKSKKGMIDEQIKETVELINTMPDFFTTSSCSGRVILFVPGMKKTEFKTLFSSHESLSITAKNIIIKSIHPDISLRFEPLIIHIRCRTIEHTASLMRSCQKDGGLKKTSIISHGRKIILEIRSTDYLEMPIKTSGDLVIDPRKYSAIKKCVQNKFNKNKKRIKRLNSALISAIESASQR
ncbi:hypothetical protein K9M79_00300 [Candidatus Woesearchaeota archaeon]|nr:hypothetical protein [Candidatus Woesearchaeota archaeon]